MASLGGGGLILDDSFSESFLKILGTNKKSNRRKFCPLFVPE